MTSATATPLRTASALSTLRAYLALTKPRVIELLLVTTVPVMVLAERGLPNLWLVLATVIGGALSAGSANSYNMYIDRDIDRHMGRTSSRPLVTGDISGRAAVIFATVLGALSIAWLWVFTTPLAALLSFAAIGWRAPPLRPDPSLH